MSGNTSDLEQLLVQADDHLIKRYKCQTCNRKFYRKSELNNHQKIAHPETAQATVEIDQTSHIEGLLTKINQQDFQIQHKNNIIIQKDSVIQHLQANHQVWFGLLENIERNVALMKKKIEDQESELKKLNVEKQLLLSVILNNANIN